MRLDPEYKFTLKLESACKIVNDRVRPIPTYELVYTNGGDNLVIAAESVPFPILFKSLSTAFVGLNALDTVKCIHNNIRPNHMLYNGTTQRVALTYFNTFAQLKDIALHRNAYTKTNYFQPGEFNLMAASGTSQTKRNSVFFKNEIMKELNTVNKPIKFQNIINEFNDAICRNPLESYTNYTKTRFINRFGT